MTERELTKWGEDILGSLVKRDERIEELEKNARANQVVIDTMVARGSERRFNQQGKTLGAEIWRQIDERKGEVKNFLSNRHEKFYVEIDTKQSGVLLVSDHVTGDVQASYSSSPAIAPNHLINFRDLIPTVHSPTGSMVTYREGTVTNSVANQTEGSAKPSQDYTWSEQKATSQYLSAVTKFSKQLMYNLPFIQSTLTAELLRDFYKKENSSFFIQAAQAATGDNVASGSPTADIEELVHMISNQLKASYFPSYAIVDPAQWARIVLTKPNDYSMPQIVSTDKDGNIRIGQTIIIAAAWAQSDKVLLIDVNQIERQETESLRVEFSYQDQDNFIKNMITARIECFETLAIRRPDSIVYRDFSNS